MPPPPGGPPPGVPPTGPPPGPGSYLPAATAVVVILVLQQQELVPARGRGRPGAGPARSGFLAFSGDEAGADEIFLEPVDFPGDDPFTDSVSTSAGEAAGEVVVDEGSAVQGSVNGSEPGLYGGTLNESMCDREQLVEFLGDNADKARAFADVLDIDVDEIPDYIADLTAVVLRGDTRVTNHGFADGEATAFQAVLQAGTAVLVDFQGIPRVKCYCGNPLTEPIEVDSPRYGGDQWDDFDPDDIR